MHDSDLCCSGSEFHHLVKLEISENTPLSSTLNAWQCKICPSKLIILSFKPSYVFFLPRIITSSTSSQKHESDIISTGNCSLCYNHLRVNLNTSDLPFTCLCDVPCVVLEPTARELHIPSQYSQKHWTCQNHRKISHTKL